MFFFLFKLSARNWLMTAAFSKSYHGKKGRRDPFIGKYNIKQGHANNKVQDFAYPGYDKFSSQVLNFGFHLATDIKLVAVKGNPLEVGQQILLAGRIRTLQKGREINNQDLIYFGLDA